MKRQSILTPRRQLLSPIDEIPQEADKFLSNTSINDSKGDNEAMKNILFHEEMSRLGQISLDDIPLPSPSKRRKLSCSLESQIGQSFNGLLTSPIKTVSV